MGKGKLRTAVNQTLELVYVTRNMLYKKKEIQWFAGLSRSLHNLTVKN